MAQQVKAAKPDDLSSIQGPTWWEERNDSESCPLTFRWALMHVYTLTHMLNHLFLKTEKKNNNPERLKIICMRLIEI